MRLWHRHRPYGHSRDCAKERRKHHRGGRGRVSHSRWILRTAARSVIRLTRYGTSRGDPPRFPGAGGGAWDNATACAACGSGFCGLNMVASPTGRQDTTSLLAVCGNVLAASDTVRRRRRWWCDRSSYKRSLFSRIRDCLAHYLTGLRPPGRLPSPSRIYVGSNTPGWTSPSFSLRVVPFCRL